MSVADLEESYPTLLPFALYVVGNPKLNGN